MGVTILLVSLAMFASSASSAPTRSSATARTEVARLAAESERNRIARDLHDLLGHSLTTITVKAGLARRLSATDPERAAAEIAEVEDLARRSLADVRAAVAGYREVTLAGELATAGEVLRAAGIEASLPRSVEHVDEHRQELFGWVVREGSPTWCATPGRRVHDHRRADWVEVADDGRSTARGRRQRPDRARRAGRGGRRTGAGRPVGRRRSRRVAAAGGGGRRTS